MQIYYISDYWLCNDSTTSLFISNSRWQRVGDAACVRQNAFNFPVSNKIITLGLAFCPGLWLCMQFCVTECFSLTRLFFVNLYTCYVVHLSLALCVCFQSVKMDFWCKCMRCYSIKDPFTVCVCVDVTNIYSKTNGQAAEHKVQSVKHVLVN